MHLKIKTHFCGHWQFMFPDNTSTVYWRWREDSRIEPDFCDKYNTGAWWPLDLLSWYLRICSDTMTKIRYIYVIRIIPNIIKYENRQKYVWRKLLFCNGNTIPGFPEISAPLWSRGQNAFLVILGARVRATSSAIIWRLWKSLQYSIYRIL